MTLEKLTLPLAITAAVIGVYVFFRGEQSQQVATGPSTQASGVLPSTIDAGQTTPGVSVPVAATAPATVTAHTPISDAAAQPWNATPGAGTSEPPSYLVHNYGPSHDFRKRRPHHPVRSVNAAGATASLKASSAPVYTLDGSSSLPLSSSPTRQVNSSDPDTWLPAVIENLMAYQANNNN